MVSLKVRLSLESAVPLWDLQGFWNLEGLTEISCEPSSKFKTLEKMKLFRTDAVASWLHHLFQLEQILAAVFQVSYTTKLVEFAQQTDIHIGN